MGREEGGEFQGEREAGNQTWGGDLFGFQRTMVLEFKEPNQRRKELEENQSTGNYKGL